MTELLQDDADYLNGPISCGAEPVGKSFEQAISPKNCSQKFFLKIV